MSLRLLAYFIQNIEPAHAPTWSETTSSSGDKKAKKKADAPPEHDMRWAHKKAKAKKVPVPPKKKTDNK